MQMALMDCHVAKEHADGADGSPRGWSTCRCRWRGAVQVILINKALRNYEEVHGSNGSKMQWGNSMLSTVPRWLWEEPRGSKNSKVMRRSYDVDCSKDGAAEVLCCQSRWRWRSMTWSIYPTKMAMERIALPANRPSQCARTTTSPAKFILIINIMPRWVKKTRLKVA